MRVITGTAKGRRLLQPSGRDIRPTTERVKEAIFSALQFDIEGRRILDLFAGSGQLSCEALSRGAQSATLVDNSESSLKIARTNIENCGFIEKAKIVKSDYSTFCSMCRDRFDIAFLDPPYHEGFLISAIKCVQPLMSDYGIIVCEHPKDLLLEQKIGDLYVSRQYHYGKINITVYKKGDNA